MHESTLVPPERVDEINRYVSLLCVPCHQNAESFAASDVHVPIRVLPHGVDTARFPYLDRPRRDVFTFGTFGDLTLRKGLDVLLRAFIREFKPDEPVRLLVKRTFATRELPWPIDPDPRIEIRTGFLDQPALLDLLQEMDAFVLPSRGEGFGLCGLEAMATGLPTIATNWSGPADYLDPTDSFPLAYRLTDARGTWVAGTRFFGQWAEPDEDHLRSLLRWLYDHPIEAAEMGRQASARVHATWTWTRTATQLLPYLDAIAQGVSPV
jgi:glycosyltransferase involved in cell wall biosynthesis